MESLFYRLILHLFSYAFVPDFHFFFFAYLFDYSILFKVYNLTQFFFFFSFISLFVHVQITQEVIDLIKPYEQAGDWDGAMKLVRQRDGNKDNKLSTYLSSVHVYFCVCVYSNLIICIQLFPFFLLLMSHYNVHLFICLFIYFFSMYFIHLFIKLFIDSLS